MLQLAGSSGAVCLVLLCSCGSKAPPSPPPPEVRVVSAKAQSIENITEVPGRVQAVRTAQVRARVDGIVERRLYDEGTDVKAGQTLFVIDPREYRANVSAVAATLTRAQATAANARQDVERYKGLVKNRRSVSKSSTRPWRGCAPLTRTWSKRKRSSRARSSI